MSKVVGVRLKKAERMYYFDPQELELQMHEPVVLETEKGLELGRVVTEPQEVAASELKEPLKPLLRKATADDLSRCEELRAREEDALTLAREKARGLGLSMKLVEAHYTLDGGRVIFHFGAEQRVDFRQLLRQLGEALHVRVELRQLGARDAARLAGGLGRCGRALCCACWLTEFCPVTIRMAKEQALPISAEGLAGRCGRLRCCLRYEYEQYLAINKTLPRVGERVNTPYGEGKVIVGHPVKETVSVILEGEMVRELPLHQITPLRPSPS